jgi:hypothetical protein
MKTSDPILSQFRAALDEIYGNRIDRVAVFWGNGDFAP